MSPADGRDDGPAAPSGRATPTTLGLIVLAGLACGIVGAVLLVLRYGVAVPLKQHAEQASAASERLASSVGTEPAEEEENEVVSETAVPILRHATDAGGFPSASDFAQLLAQPGEEAADERPSVPDAAGVLAQGEPQEKTEEGSPPRSRAKDGEGAGQKDGADPRQATERARNDAEGPRALVASAAPVKEGASEAAATQDGKVEGGKVEEGRAGADQDGEAVAVAGAAPEEEVASQSRRPSREAERPTGPDYWVLAPGAAGRTANANQVAQRAPGTMALVQAPTDRDAVQPPAPWATQPPAPGLTTPPAPWATQPPAPGLTTPPAPWATMPPAPGLTTPPAPWATQPPSPGLNTPPAPWGTTPPAPGLTPPPAAWATRPPAPALITPPAPWATQPPSPGMTPAPSGGLFAPPPQNNDRERRERR